MKLLSIALGLAGLWSLKKALEGKQKDGVWDSDGRLVPREG